MKRSTAIGVGIFGYFVLSGLAAVTCKAIDQGNTAYAIGFGGCELALFILLVFVIMRAVDND